MHPARLYVFITMLCVCLPGCAAPQSADRQPTQRAEPAGPADPPAPQAPATPTTAVVPRAAPQLALNYLTPRAEYDLMYDNFLASTVKTSLPRQQVIQRLQDNYYPLVRLLQRIAADNTQEVAFRWNRKDRQCAFWLRKHARVRGELWGVGFRWERVGWRLEQTRPDIFSLQATPPEPAP